MDSRDAVFPDVSLVGFVQTLGILRDEAVQEFIEVVREREGPEQAVDRESFGRNLQNHGLDDFAAEAEMVAAHYWLRVLQEEEEFAKYGARVEFLSQQVDDTPEGKLLLQIQGAVGEYERAKILDRTRRGRQHKARQGLMRGGQAPYGYDYVPGVGCRWRVNETEAAVVREVFRLLNEEGRTLTSIAQELARRGVPTKRGGLTWGHSSVHRMLKNEAYAGTAYFFKEAPIEPQERRDDSAYRRRLKTSQRRRDRSEWIEVQVPAIIERVTWDRAQERLQENARFSPRNNKRHFHLLRGLLKCGHCGRTLAGQKMNPGAYYECGGKDRLGPKTADTCRAKAVRTDRIEPLVWEAVERLVNDPVIILEQYEVEQGDREAQAASAVAARKRAETRLAELAAEEMQVVRLFRAGKIGETVLDAQLAEVRRERECLEEELQAAAETLACGMRLESEGELIRRFCEDLRDSFSAATGEEKQQVLRLLVNRIVVDPRRRPRQAVWHYPGAAGNPGIASTFSAQGKVLGARPHRLSFLAPTGRPPPCAAPR